VKGEQLQSTSVNSPFTDRSIAKDTDIKGYESIEVHGVRNRCVSYSNSYHDLQTCPKYALILEIHIHYFRTHIFIEPESAFSILFYTVLMVKIVIGLAPGVRMICGDLSRTSISLVSPSKK
jgi:hypothetical protein